MNGDEMSRGMYQQNRKPSSPNRQSYSPSSNFSYNYNSNNNGNGNGNTGYSGQQHAYKKPMHGGGGRPDHKFKSHHGSGGGSNDKLLKQNDQIIKLLKEIRDRLPAPVPSSITTLPLVNEPEFYDQEGGSATEYIDNGNEGDDVDGVDTEASDDQEFAATDEENFNTEER